MNAPDTLFDVFSMPEGTSMAEQRDFEIYWKKYTGRTCIVVTGVEYLTTLPWGGAPNNA